MKRHRTLVEYASSDEESASETSKTLTVADPPSVRAKRKLPELSSNLIDPVPQSDPALHQGRIRSSPHVEGQFAAYVYVSIVLDRKSALWQLLDAVVQSAKVMVPTLHGNFCDSGQQAGGMVQNGQKDAELHISLSRPLYLRHYQREDIKRAVKRAAHSHRPFTASFASFASFDNDERTRTFLGVEVGAGYSELRALSDALSPALLLLHQQVFYSEPRFHASFAWALLDPPPKGRAESTSPPGTLPSQNGDFPTIPAFPSSLVFDLNAQYGARLASKLGVFEVGEIKVKIGKEVFSWALQEGNLPLS